MCGLCGAVGAAPDLPRLHAALRATAHRGPDDVGSWCGPRAMLGHRRLAIVDRSADGRQPMANEDATVQVVLNGAIYNHAELRRSLEGRHRFASRTDTEVLVHGYEEWGIDGLLARIRGMFAFAIHDERRGVLHLARDPLGEKPLYYALDGGRCLFASTLPAVLALRDRATELSPTAVQDYLVHLCVPADAALVEGVRKLLPGHRAEFAGGELRLQRYWRLSFAHQEARAESEWLELIEAELRRAVRSQLAADVPVGVFLSGGVDSSLVAAMAASESSAHVTTISAGFDEAGFDERAHARRVAARLGTDHHEYVLRPHDAGTLPWLVHTAGEPIGDHAVLPLLMLAQQARALVGVALTGDGGDEAFGGYSGPLIARVAAPYQRWIPARARAAAPDTLAWLGAHGAHAATVRRLRRVAVAARAPRGLTWEPDALGESGFRGRLTDLLCAEYRARLTERDPSAYWRDAFDGSDGPTAADRVLFTELTTQLPDRLLVKTDVATMAYGVEARAPLLDVGLVELAARIPAATKLAGLSSKRLLKRLAARHVPLQGVYRPKQGLAVPTARWMRGSLGDVTRAVLLSEASLSRGIFQPAAVRRLLDEHRLGQADHGQRLWLLLQLELWSLMFVDRTLSPTERLLAAQPEAGA